MRLIGSEFPSNWTLQDSFGFARRPKMFWHMRHRFETRKCKSPNLSKKNENLKLFLFSEIFRWDRRCRKVEWCFQSLFADKRVFEIWLRHHKMTFQSLPQISNWAQQHKILYAIKNVVGFLSFASNAGLNMLLLGLKFFWWLSDGLRNCMQ